MFQTPPTQNVSPDFVLYLLCMKFFKQMSHGSCGRNTQAQALTKLYALHGLPFSLSLASLFICKYSSMVQGLARNCLLLESSRWKLPQVPTAMTLGTWFKSIVPTAAGSMCHKHRVFINNSYFLSCPFLEFLAF